MLRKILAALGLALVALLLTLNFTTNHSYVTTPSMYPTIPPGSEVLIDRAANYQVGDVVEFRGNGLLWVHRVVKIKANGDLITKGDNPQNAPDVFVPAITRADILGRVIAAPKWLGFPALLLHHPVYGMGWLRAELGFWGKLLVVVSTAILVYLATRRIRVEAADNAPRHHRPSPIPMNSR